MMNKLKNYNLKSKTPGSQRGFTMLESIVAIFILSLSISGAFSAVVQGLSQATLAKDEIKAFYLAQEAVEIIRNKRDTNQIASLSDSSVSWLDGIAKDNLDPCYFGKVCKATAVSTSLISCGTAWDSCDNLKQDSTTFLYNYSTGNTTNFKREIKLRSVNPNEIEVTVRVSWKKGVLTRNFEVKAYLFKQI